MAALKMIGIRTCHVYNRFYLITKTVASGRFSRTTCNAITGSLQLFNYCYYVYLLITLGSDVRTVRASDRLVRARLELVFKYASNFQLQSRYIPVEIFDGQKMAESILLSETGQLHCLTYPYPIALEL
jgi:hypothetical protein